MCSFQSRKSSDVKTPNGSEFEEDETEELEEGIKITVGICAMNKKVGLNLNDRAHVKLVKSYLKINYCLEGPSRV